MTTEKDFQLLLDKHPEDWQTRLTLADFLEEQGDIRAAGYRNLGTLRKFPDTFDNNYYWCNIRFFVHELDNHIPSSIFNVLSPIDCIFKGKYLADYKNRQAAEDAYALAYHKGE